MTLKEKIMQVIFGKVGTKKLPTTPNNERLTFINSDEDIRIYNWRCYKIWYNGDSNELLNFYTNMQVFGWLYNPIYNRNNVNSFWGKSAEECNIKRVHSGVPRAIVDTTTNIVGKPNIQGDTRLERIFKVNDFGYKLVNIFRVMALVQGDGAVKWNVNPKVSSVPLMEYYEAEDWEPIEKSGLLFGMIFKTYYKDEKGDNYVLFETRSLVTDGCEIKYELYKLGKDNDIKRVELNKIPELAGLQDMKLPVRHLFASPLRYYYNPLHPGRGKSMYDGVVDLFDFLDEIWSQASQTNRVSTPVEYYNVDILERTKKGKLKLPKLYNRQFVEGPGQTNADGISENKGIETTQPDLNFDKYAQLAASVLDYILIGRLSPSSLGIDIAKKDNADAQREKEKQSLFTRGNIIERETRFLEELCNDALILQDYIDTGVMADKVYDVSVKYDEFANPSFESELGVLGPAWSQGQISTEQYVKMLWAGKMDDEEMSKEIAWLDENKQSDNLNLEELMNERSNNQDLSEQGLTEGQVAESEE